MSLESRRGTVVVTGASSGIGRATARRLASAGFTVLAGVRRDRDADVVRSEGAHESYAGALLPLHIDVTDPTSIVAAVASVEAHLHSHEEEGLRGLVNNAGAGLFGPVEYLPLDAVRRQFEVNVYGVIAVTQGFLPLLRRARGRIVNIGSVGDSIAMPFGGALCASKAAIRLLNDSLRQELAPSGVRVILVRPASIHTPAVEKLAADIETVVEALPATGREEYADVIHSFADRALERERGGSSPDVVATAVLRGLTARRPGLRYHAGKDSALLTLLPRLLTDRRLDGVRRRLFGLPGFGTRTTVTEPASR